MRLNPILKRVQGDSETEIAPYAGEPEREAAGQLVYFTRVVLRDW